MRTSETLTKLPAALVAAQSEIRFAVKDAKNPHLKSTYADLGSVIDAVKPALNKNGISVIQTASPSDDGKLHLTTRLLHASGEWLQDTMVMPLQKSDPQGMGSAMTYARRYSIAAICGLYQDDDDGHAASQPAKAQAQAPLATLLDEMPLDEAKEYVRKQWSTLGPSRRMEAAKYFEGRAK